ncbi:MAG: hypothetical protein ACREGF_02165 [Candidatus Saccharimonadales bacterium]
MIFHITVALASILYSTFLFIAPSKLKLYGAYSLVGLTIASGSFLVVNTHVRILQACITGLVYIATVSVGIIFAHYKLDTKSQ